MAFPEDLFRIRYDSQRVTPQTMLDVIRQQGFDGKVVSNAPRSGDGDSPTRRDLTRLDDDLKAAVREALEGQKLLLLAFSAPG